jgi:DNA-binding winged helix-turn-helix (wHTH) protein
VGRREQLVSREEIVGKLWRSDLFIDTEPNINNIVRKIRTALGDDASKPRFLETVVGKGTGSDLEDEIAKRIAVASNRPLVSCLI